MSSPQPQLKIRISPASSPRPAVSEEAGRSTPTPHNVRFELTREAFLVDLHRFMEGKGQPINKVPSLGYQELDLHTLYKLVIARGGMDEVTRRQEWKGVYQDLNIPTMSTSASYNTRTNYKKYLYLYELEHCDFSDGQRPIGMEPRFAIGQHIRIVSDVLEGQVFYAQIVKCRYRDGRNIYYVHYNGWSSSHDEWMPEEVLAPLLEEEQGHSPETLANPPPSRSSKSNRIIEDPLLLPGERPLPALGSHPGSARSSGTATPSAKRQKDSSGYEGGGKSAESVDDDSENEGEDYGGHERGGAVPAGRQSMASAPLPRGGGQGQQRLPYSSQTPLDRAPLQPDWQLIRQELFEAEAEQSLGTFSDSSDDVPVLGRLGRPGSGLTVRRLHVHNVAEASAHTRKCPVDAEQLRWMEAEAFDLEPGNVLLRSRLARAVMERTARQVSHVVPDLAGDPRSLEELQDSVADLGNQLRVLERQYRKNQRLLARMPKTAPPNDGNPGHHSQRPAATAAQKALQTQQQSSPAGHGPDHQEGLPAVDPPAAATLPSTASSVRTSGRRR